MKVLPPRLERIKSGWAVRLRCGAGQHHRFRIHLEKEAAATERAQGMADLSRLLVSSGKSREAKVILRKAGEQPTAAGFAEVRAFAVELCGARIEPDRQLVTFRQLAERWTSGELARIYPDHVKTKKSTSEDRQRLAKLYPAVGEVPLRDFTLADAKRAMASIPGGRLPATRRHYAQLVSRVLTLAAWPCEIIARSPLPRGFLPAVGKRPAFSCLWPAEDERLLACTIVPFARRLFYGLLSREGLRAGEARRLLWRHLDLEHGVLRLDVNKTGAPRVWALSEGVTRTLAALAAGHGPDALVFPDVEDKIARAFRADLKAAGVDRTELFERTPQRRPIRVHDLRGTFVTTAMNEGRSEAWICDRTGHTTSAQLNGYRRAARTAAELRLGSLKPLDQCLPDLAELVAGGAELAEGVTRVCSSLVPVISPPGELPNHSEAVREEGLEPPRLAALEPKDSLSMQGDAGPQENRGLDTGGHMTVHEAPAPAHPRVELRDPVELALAHALEAATNAREWTVVAQLATELAARRRDPAS